MAIELRLFSLQREQFVYDRLRAYYWDRLTEAQRLDAARQVLSRGGTAGSAFDHGCALLAENEDANDPGDRDCSSIRSLPPELANEVLERARATHLPASCRRRQIAK